MSHDPYCYPGTNILKNKFDILDEAELKAAEARVAALALFALEDETISGPIDEIHLQFTHRRIFEKIYSWAGAYRENVGTMTKGRDGGYAVIYGSSQFVPGEMKRIFNELKTENYLQALGLEELAHRLTYYYSEIDSTHPFREGNSRTLRIFSADLATSAGYQLDWEPTGRTAQSINDLYVARDYAFNRRDYARLRAIIHANLTKIQL